MSTNMPSNSTFSSSNMGGPNAAMGGAGMMGRIGYTPESHVSKPRNISSNEIRQRTMDGSVPQYGYSGNLNEMTPGGQDPNQDLQYDITLQMQK